ncbi:MAG: SH3 domain-containing protein, partial [Anaerolineales bacterium]
FNGELDDLPCFTENLAPLLEPEAALAQEENAVKPMSRNQKWVVTGILTGILLLLGLMIFACIFTVRLWPLAFPGPTATPAPTMTATMILSPTPTTEPSNTPTESLSPTPTFTFTPSPTLQPTNTPTPQPTPYVQTGSLRGDLNLRSGPSTQFRSLGVIKTGEQVIILEQRDFWLHVQWPLDGEPLLDGWLWSQYVILTPIP